MNFSYITKSLNKLKDKKDQKQKEEYQKAFDELKKKIISQLILILLRREGKFRVETNILEYAIRKVLSQEQEEKQKLIAFLLRTIQAAERNYKIYNKELLVIVKALKKWKQYLLDTIEKFEVWMDYENLKYFREPYKLNR